MSDLTWEIERFAGEGSCVEVPICGPNSRSDLGETLPEPDDEACCYIFSLMCGA